jgi:cobalt-zinc-cadmium efflux system protein
MTHEHEHDHRSQNHGRAFAISVTLNVLFVVVEVVYGVSSHSVALVADAGHNLSDVLGLGLAWAALSFSNRKPSRTRTYGLRRSSIFAALINATLLLVVTGAVVWEAIARLGSPQPIEGWTMVVVAAIGIVVNAGSALFLMAGNKEDLNVRGAFLHLAADAGVSLGVVLGGVVILKTGWMAVDPIVSILVSIVIVVTTWELLRDAVNLLLDAVPKGVDIDAVRKHLECRQGVQAVHDLHVWALSTTENALTAHLVIAGPYPAADFVHIICEELREQFRIHHSTIQIEPSKSGGVDCPQAPDNVV